MRAVYQIFVEEQLIDLDPSTKIGITLQAADFLSGDLTSRKASFTNQIKVPITKTNVYVFGFSNNPKSVVTFPFIKKSVKVLSNGIQIFDGIVMIKSVDRYFNLQLYSINKDLSFRIANLYLSDLDFGDSPITWNAAFIDSKRASTSGWCAPVVDYGQIDRTVAGDLSIGTYYLPSISYKDIVTTILTNAGYTVSGDFYTSNSDFNNMVMTFGRESFPSTSLKMNEALSTTILQSDLLKDFLVKFGLFFRTNNNNIEIVQLETILNDFGNAVDWTNKRVRNKKDIISYTWPGFAVRNNFSYPDITNLPDGYSTSFYNHANGFLQADNENLNPSADIYTSLFDQPTFINTTIPERIEGTSSNFVKGVTSQVWNSIPSSFTFDVVPKPILAILKSKEGSECNVKYNGVSRSDYLVARFNAGSLSTPINCLAWKDNSITPNIGLLELHYPSFQNLLTNGTIATTHEYNLNDIDINSVDLLTPIFDDGNYYLINKINNYASGFTTRVELLQISKSIAQEFVDSSVWQWHSGEEVQWYSGKTVEL